MAWLASAQELCDMMCAAFFSSADPSLRAAADAALQHARRDAMNFGDRCAEVLIAALKPNESNSSKVQLPPHIDPVAFAQSAAFLLKDVCRPAAWLEAQQFSDKSHVASVLHDVAFHCEHRRVATMAMIAFAGIAVAEFPNEIWTRFIYATSTAPAPPTPSLSSSSSLRSSPARSGSGNMMMMMAATTGSSDHNSSPTMAAAAAMAGSANHNNNNNSDGGGGGGVSALSRRFSWMNHVLQHLSSSVSFSAGETQERIALRLALLDYLEQFLTNSAAAARSATSVMTTTTARCEAAAWSLACSFVLQIPASKRGTFPVVRSLVQEASRRILGTESSVGSSSSNSNNGSIALVWSPSCTQRQRRFHIAACRSQLLLLKVAPSFATATSVARLLAASVGCGHGADDHQQQNYQSVALLPGPLWKAACEVLFKFQERDADEFKAAVPTPKLVEILARILVVAPSSDEVFSNVRDASLLLISDEGVAYQNAFEFDDRLTCDIDALESENADGDDDDDDDDNDFEAGEEHHRHSSSEYKNMAYWRTPVSAQQIAERIASSFDSEQTYLECREESLLSDVKDIDGSGITGNCCASLSSVCISLVELVVEQEPAVAANAVGATVAALLSRDSAPLPPLDVAHGCCTLLLAAFRQFHVSSASSGFASAVSAGDAQSLFQRILELAGPVLLEQCVLPGSPCRHDASHAAARLITVAAVLCEGQQELQQRQLLDFCSNVMWRMQTQQQQQQSMTHDVVVSPLLLCVHSACAFAQARLAAKSPAILSEMEGTLARRDLQPPMFAAAFCLAQQQGQRSEEVGLGGRGGDHCGSERIPFTLCAITELVLTHMELGSQAGVAALWQSQDFFNHVLSPLNFCLSEASFKTESPMTNALRRLLRAVVSGHNDHFERGVCQQLQAVISPILQAAMTTAASDGGATRNRLETPTGAVLTEQMRELIQTRRRCDCCRSRFIHEVFARLTVVSISDVEAQPSDSHVRIASKSAAAVAACYEQPFGDQLDGFVQNDVLVRFISLLKHVLSPATTTRAILMPHTVSIWGFAAAFALRRLAQHGAAAVSHPSHIAALALDLMKSTCTFLRSCTKLCELAGVAHLLGVIGRLSLPALSEAMRQLTMRDVSLIWSMWCTVACELSEREFAPMMATWVTWRENGGNSGQQQLQFQGASTAAESAAALVDVSAALQVFVLAPIRPGGVPTQRKSAKNSIVADDLARNGTCCANVGAAMDMVMQFRQSVEFKKIPVRGNDFPQECFASFF